MKRMLILLIALMVISVGFLSGCDEKAATKKEDLTIEGSQDTDGDGLNNNIEKSIGTDPNNPNTDGDRYLDGEEHNDTLPSYVLVDGRSPVFPAYPDIKIQLSDSYHIWLKQDITVAKEKIESRDYEYTIESMSTTTTNWSNVLNVEVGYGLTSGLGIFVKDTFSYYHSTTHTLRASQRYRMASATKWSKAVSTDLGDSYLYITLQIKNIGTDILESEIDDIWLSLYIGDDEDPIKTWSFGHDYIGGKIGPLQTGEERIINAEFHQCLNIERLKRIDMGEPVRIEVQSYNLGEDEQYLQNVKDTLIQLDIDTGVRINTNFIKEDSIKLTEFLKKYADAILGSGNIIQSINGLAINDSSWWDIIIPEKTGLPQDISLAIINNGDHVVLIYDQDSDNDGITNRLEFMAGLDPYSIDTDGDGITDYEELYETYGDTNPLLADTDFDSLTDYEEVVSGSDGYITDPTSNDTDMDGLSDYEEYLNNTNPNNDDTDGDGLKDGDEVKTHGTQPLDADTDDDNVDDGEEISQGTDPLDDDSDDDGLNDGDENGAGTDPLDSDTDDDGYLDGDDFVPGWNASINVTILKFMVIDEVDWLSNWAQVYRQIETEDGKKVRWPGSGNELDVQLGVMKTVNWDYIYDVPDNQLSHKIIIGLYDSDLVADDALDIDGMHTGSSNNALTLYYNIVSGDWTGDDTDGKSDGSDDGSESSDEDDAYIEYNITTV